MTSSRSPHLPPAPDALLDTGLLSPTRAGTPVEQAVSDHAWLAAMIEAETGLARAQARLGTVPADAALLITEVGAGARLDLTGLARAAREAANPVVGFVRDFTAQVAAHDSEAAEYVHRGSTSQDIMDSAAMLIAQRALRHTLNDLDRCATALAGLAREHRDTVMAGRTLTLHAVPTTFGLKAAGWLQLVHDARQRTEQLLASGLPAQLGGAAGTLAGYLEYAGHGWAGTEAPAHCGAYTTRLTEAYAEELGLAVPTLPWHVLRTPIADIATTCAFLGAALGKIAVDVQSLGRTEVAEVMEPAVTGRGASSAMPQKRNPVLASLIRAAALQLPALASGLIQCVTTEDERSGGVWHAEWEPLRECLRLAGGAAHTAAELTEGLVVRPDRMRANLELTGGAIVSERIVAQLAPSCGKSRARELLTTASRTAAEEGRPLAVILSETPEVTAWLAPHRLAALTDPAHYTGAAGPLVDQALRRHENTTAERQASAMPIVATRP